MEWPYSFCDANCAKRFGFNKSLTGAKGPTADTPLGGKLTFHPSRRRVLNLKAITVARGIN
jgi:hypothetical protein